MSGFTLIVVPNDRLVIVGHSECFLIGGSYFFTADVHRDIDRTAVLEFVVFGKQRCAFRRTSCVRFNRLVDGNRDLKKCV